MTTRSAVLALALVLGLGLAAPAAARANTIGPTNCLTCYGNSYTLTYFQTGSTQYTINLIIDASGYDAGVNSAYLMSIAPGIPGWTMPASLLSAPGGTGDWSAVQAGGINASGCDGSGSPFFCNSALSQGTFNEVGTTTPLDFSWSITDASLPTGAGGVSLKAYYADSSGNKVGPLLSEDMTLTMVPEPATWWLLGTGLLLLGCLWRRQRRVPLGTRPAASAA